jgi:hypothetical protein
MKAVRVVCKCCKGEGSIELTGIYAETLFVLSRQTEEVSGAALARVVGCNNTAMCNRLKALEGHGLAVSRPYGRKLLWRVAR